MELGIFLRTKAIIFIQTLRRSDDFYMWLCVQFTETVPMIVIVFKNGFQVHAKTGRQLLQSMISTVTNPKDIQMVNLW